MSVNVEPTTAQSMMPLNSSFTQRFSNAAAQVYSMTEYRGKVYFGYNVDGGFSGANDLTGASTAIAAPSMPGVSNQLFMLRERMFSVDYNASLVYWSKETDPLNWVSPDGGNFPVNVSDTQPIVGVIVLNNAMWIFKRSGVWLFSYTDNPETDGQLQKIVDHTIISVCEHNGRMYVFDGRQVSQFLNGQFISLSDKLLFTVVETSSHQFITEAYIGCVDNYLILSMSEGTTAQSFVMNLRNGAWAQWKPASSNTQLTRDQWPCSHMVKDPTNRVAIWAGASVTTKYLIGIDFTVALKNYKAIGASQYAQYGGQDNAGNSIAGIRLTTKAFGLGDYGHIKKFKYIRSLVEIDHPNSGQFPGIRPAWNVILDKFNVNQTNWPPKALTGTHRETPGTQSISTSNVRFRQVQFQFTYIVQSNNEPTMAIVEGLLFYFRTSNAQRLL
jgi:hypothetical protein